MDAEVAAHYGRAGLPAAFLDGAAAAGLDVERLGPAELAAADEFHIGGRQATLDLAAQLDLLPGMRLLDVGSGPGGTARFIAAEYGCRVTGIDVTPEYVRLATELAARTGLADLVTYECADAGDLPLPDGSFEGAFLLHVGMNVPDKAGLCAEVARVLVPGGFFAVYDVMRIGDGELEYPVPWAGRPEISFVETTEHYRTCLEAAGFGVGASRERRVFGLEFFRAMRERIAAGGLPPLGLHLLLGEDFAQKVGNVVSGLERSVIAPVEMIARRPATA